MFYTKYMYNVINIGKRDREGEKLFQKTLFYK